MEHQYLGPNPPVPLDDPTLSPALASSLAELPHTIIGVGEHDSSTRTTSTLPRGSKMQEWTRLFAAIPPSTTASSATGTSPLLPTGQLTKSAKTSVYD